MSEPTCGASVQAIAARVAVLGADGVPLPGSANLYVTDSLSEMSAKAVYSAGVDIEKMNAGGGLCVVYKGKDLLKRYDLTFTICSWDPELETTMVGGEKFTSSGQTVGFSSPAVGVDGCPFGVSVELWSKHITDGDIDAVWPYIHWAFPRTYWTPGDQKWDNNAQDRELKGYTSENPNWYNGPANDWSYSSDRSMMSALTKTHPTPVCGSQTLAAS